MRTASNLAGRLATLARLPGEEAALDRSLELITSELAAAAVDDPYRSVALSTLAGSHLHLWQRGGDRDRLEAGLHLVVTALGTTDVGPEVVNIAGLIAEAAVERSDADLLAQAEALTRAALARPKVLPAAVGRAVGDRAGLVAAIGDARAAMFAARHEAINDPDEHEYLSNLAILLAERYDLVGDSTDLNEAIELLDTAMAMRPPLGIVASIATNQANNLLSRFELDRDMADLNRGIDLIESAIAGTASDSAELAARHGTAGRLRASRGHHLERLDEVAAAEAHAAEAVRMTAEQSPGSRRAPESAATTMTGPPVCLRRPLPSTSASSCKSVSRRTWNAGTKTSMCCSELRISWTVSWSPVIPT